MSDNGEYNGIPKTSPLYYTGKGKLDEKSSVKTKDDLILLNKNYYNVGDIVSVLNTGEIYKLTQYIDTNGKQVIEWCNINDCGTWS